MLIAIIIILYVATVAFDYGPMAKERAKKDNAIYWVILAVSFIVLILFSFNIRVPGPSGGIRTAVESIFGPIK